MSEDDDFVDCDERIYNGGIDCNSPQLHHWHSESYCGIRTIDAQLKKDGVV